MDAGLVDDVMEFMRQYAPQGASQKHVSARTKPGVCRSERAAHPVAFHIGKRNDGAVGYSGISQGDRFRGQGRRHSFHLAAPMEGYHHDAGERIRGGKLVRTPPAQLYSGVLHKALELPLHFADGGIGMPGLELKHNCDVGRREGGAGRRDKSKQCANDGAHKLSPDGGDK